MTATATSNNSAIPSRSATPSSSLTPASPVHRYRAPAFGGPGDTLRISWCGYGARPLDAWTEEADRRFSEQQQGGGGTKTAGGEGGDAMPQRFGASTLHLFEDENGSSPVLEVSTRLLDPGASFNSPTSASKQRQQPTFGGRLPRANNNTRTVASPTRRKKKSTEVPMSNNGVWPVVDQADTETAATYYGDLFADDAEQGRTDGEERLDAFFLTMEGIVQERISAYEDQWIRMSCFNTGGPLSRSLGASGGGIESPTSSSPTVLRPQLRVLDLSGNELRDEGVKRLVQLFRSTPKTFEKLARIVLQFNQITAEGMRYVLDLVKEIEEQYVQEQHRIALQDRALRRMQSGRALGQTASGAGFASGTKNVSSSFGSPLGLTRSTSGAFDQRGEYGVTLLPNWRSLDVEWNDLDDDGAEVVAEILAAQSFLTDISCSCNHIGATGMQKLQDAVKLNANITSMGLEDNEVGAEQILALVQHNAKMAAQGMVRRK